MMGLWKSFSFSKGNPRTDALQESLKKVTDNSGSELDDEKNNGGCGMVFCKLKSRRNGDIIDLFTKNILPSIR